MCGNVKTTRRSFVLGAVATMVGGVVASPEKAEAQTYQLLCSWAGGAFGQGLAPATGFAEDQVFEIAEAIDYYENFSVFMGGVSNAAATLIQGRPAVIYNPHFLNRLHQCHQIAAMTVLAHEVGHLANRDTHWRSQFKHPWSKELGADWVSGFAMSRLGIPLQAAQSGILCSFGRFSPGSASHPDSQRRLRAVTQGWHAA